MKIRIPLPRRVEADTTEPDWCREQPWWPMVEPMLRLGCVVLVCSSRPPPGPLLDGLDHLAIQGDWTGRGRVIFPPVLVPIERQALSWAVLVLPSGSAFPDVHTVSQMTGFVGEA